MAAKFGWMFMRVSLLFFCCFLSSLAIAEDSLNSVMSRMKSGSATAITYQETRELGLLVDEWKGSGVFYATAPGTLIKQQIQPESEIMGVIGNQLYYYKPDDETRYQTEMDDSDAMTLPVIAFKGLMNGDLKFLRQFYEVDYTATKEQWTLKLTAKYFDQEEGEEATLVIMQGVSGKPAHKLDIHTADGDFNAFVLSPAEQSEQINIEITRLSKLLNGN